MSKYPSFSRWEGPYEGTLSSFPFRVPGGLPPGATVVTRPLLAFLSSLFCSPQSLLLVFWNNLPSKPPAPKFYLGFCFPGSQIKTPATQSESNIIAPLSGHVCSIFLGIILETEFRASPSSANSNSLSSNSWHQILF